MSQGIDMTDEQKVQWERLLPREFREAVARLPVVFLPLGTVECHGEHNALGLDALKAHALCAGAAGEAGGGVRSPVYGVIGGVGFAAAVRDGAPQASVNRHLSALVVQRGSGSS